MACDQKHLARTRRYRAGRKARAIAALGGECAICGEIATEIVSVYPGERGRYYTNGPLERLLAHLDLIAALCYEHAAQWRSERRHRPTVRHGTTTGYMRGCRCRLCTGRYAEYRRSVRATPPRS